MRTTSSHPKTHHEDKNYLRLERKIFRAFRKRPHTINMVVAKTRISTETICLFVSNGQAASRILLLYFDRCKITGEIDAFYTTDTELIKANKAEVSHGS
jgi:3-oxoacyl-[acyl-carrier-protein] synthase III